MTRFVGSARSVTVACASTATLQPTAVEACGNSWSAYCRNLLHPVNAVFCEVSCKADQCSAGAIMPTADSQLGQPLCTTAIKFAHRVIMACSNEAVTFLHAHHRCDAGGACIYPPGELHCIVRCMSGSTAMAGLCIMFHCRHRGGMPLLFGHTVASMRLKSE